MFQQNLIKIPKLANKLTAKLLIKTGVINNYQPMINMPQSIRVCEDRLNKIKQTVCAGSLCLDIGCNTGYFASEISKLRIFTIGLESELKNVIVSESQYKLPNLVFKHFKLDKDSVAILPQADIILFLSVFHHLVKYYGQNESVAVLEKLASKCKSHFYFETGQSDELGTRWCNLMKFTNNIEDWVNDFFVNKCDYKEVRKLGAFETFLTKTKRNLFLATRR
jgi:SAM-dependent methyltransferase